MGAIAVASGSVVTSSVSEGHVPKTCAPGKSYYEWIDRCGKPGLDVRCPGPSDARPGLVYEVASQRCMLPLKKPLIQKLLRCPDESCLPRLPRAE